MATRTSKRKDSLPHTAVPDAEEKDPSNEELAKLLGVPASTVTDGTYKIHLKRYQDRQQEQEQAAKAPKTKGTAKAPAKGKGPKETPLPAPVSVSPLPAPQPVHAVQPSPYAPHPAATYSQHPGTSSFQAPAVDLSHQISSQISAFREEMHQAVLPGLHSDIATRLQQERDFGNELVVHFGNRLDEAEQKMESEVSRLENLLQSIDRKLDVFVQTQQAQLARMQQAQFASQQQAAQTYQQPHTTWPPAPSSAVPQGLTHPSAAASRSVTSTYLQCKRCGKMFSATFNPGPCKSHPGQLFQGHYSCCNQGALTMGCAEASHMA